MSSQTLILTAGATGKSVDLNIVQKAAATSPGDPITGLAYNTGSLTAYGRLNNAAAAAISLLTQTATGAYSSGGFVEIDATHLPGQYRFDIPAAYIASAGVAAITFNGAANMETHTLNLIITAVDFYDAIRAGLTALPIVPVGTGVMQAGSTATTAVLANATTTDKIGPGDMIVHAGGSAIVTSAGLTGSGEATPTANVFGWGLNIPAGGAAYMIFRMGNLVPFITPVGSDGLQQVNQSSIIGYAITRTRNPPDNSGTFTTA